ncbi:ferritin-like domain-containing protein [Cytidiella melzeri]|nr:ferritin-like domain-containing protein [Cytidiella melzeri]
MKASLLPSVAAALASIVLALPTVPPPVPAGGIGTSLTDVPVYKPMSEFDAQSFQLALNQELIELDLFNYALAKFSPEEFEEAGLGPDEQFLIKFFAEQEVGHATLFKNMLGSNASEACQYSYPFETVSEFIDFSVKLTRSGESGTLGFLPHLNSQASAALINEAISTESRQEFALRQFEGLFPVPFWFTPTITQSMAWTLLAPYITACPASNPKLMWQNFPALNITNSPNGTVLTNGSLAIPSLSTNRTALSSPGDKITLSWEGPGKQVGPNNSYTTTTSAGQPQFAAWISQLNVTYTPLEDVHDQCRSATTTQPGGEVYGNGTAPTVNGTMFVLITDKDLFVTPYNLSMLNKHVVAGPASYTAG